MKTDDGAMLYQAYVFRDEKRVEAENYYVTAGGVVYKQYTIDGGVTDLRPVSLANITGQRIVIRITAPSVRDRKCKEIEEIMCATFDCDDENTPYEYTNGLKRYIYLDGNTHNYNLNNMKSCDFWEYLKWAHCIGIHVQYTRKNRQQIRDKFSQDGLSMYAFSKKYSVPHTSVYNALRYEVPAGLELECTDSIDRIIRVDGKVLHQAYMFENGKRVQLPRFYISKDAVVYKKYNATEKKYNDACPAPYIKNTGIPTISIPAPSKIRKVEEIMCATFDCDENTPYEYTNGLKRYIYLDNNPRNCSLNNIKSCDFWEYMRWANDANISTRLTKMNIAQICDRFSEEKLNAHEFARKYKIRCSTICRIVRNWRKTNEKDTHKNYKTDC